MGVRLSGEHRRYIRNELLVCCVVNAMFGLAFAFLFFHDVSTIPFWGAGGIAVDLIPTVFMLTLMGNLAATYLTRSRVTNGKVSPVDPGALGPIARYLPGNALVRVLTMAIVLTILVVPISIVGLILMGVSSMQFWLFVVFKVIYGAFIGSLSAPTILRAALGDSVPGRIS